MAVAFIITHLEGRFDMLPGEYVNMKILIREKSLRNII